MREKKKSETLERKKSETLEKEKRGKKKSETLEREKRENKKSKTLEGKQLCLAIEREVRRVLCARQPLYLSFCQRQMLSANQFDEFKLPFGIESLL